MKYINLYSAATHAIAQSSFALLLSFSCVLSFSSCSENNTDSEISSLRIDQNIRALQSTLTAAENGWEVIYFPRVDSLLFTNMNTVLDRYSYPNNLGTGGFTFYMHFAPDGTVVMQGDFADTISLTPQRSEYKVHQNSSTMLTFTTYNYLHRTINSLLRGTADWLYVGVNSDSALVFRSGNFIEPAREMMIMRRVKSSEEADSVAHYSLQHRNLFEAMVNPQIKIYRGDRIFFGSDYFVKTRVSTNESYVQSTFAKRYYMFLFVSKPNPIPGNFPSEIKGLGSGYVGTSQGMTFYPGFRYSSDFTFRDFAVVDGKLVSELVRIYDPATRTYRYVSKHIYPQGEYTGMMAEIYDASR